MIYMYFSDIICLIDVIFWILEKKKLLVIEFFNFIEIVVQLHKFRLMQTFECRVREFAAIFGSEE